MGGHQSAAMLKDEWLTPREILEALGAFDLDPCAPAAERRPWPTAAAHYSAEDDGLSRHWSGRVWLNPPYGRWTGRWLQRLAQHGQGTALIFARTETADWHDYVWPLAQAVLFLRGRLHFHHVDGRRAAANAGAPSALIAYGQRDADLLRASGIGGKFIQLRPTAATEGSA